MFFGMSKETLQQLLQMEPNWLWKCFVREISFDCLRETEKMLEETENIWKSSIDKREKEKKTKKKSVKEKEMKERTKEKEKERVEI